MRTIGGRDEVVVEQRTDSRILSTSPISYAEPRLLRRLDLRVAAAAAVLLGLLIGAGALALLQAV